MAQFPIYISKLSRPWVFMDSRYAVRLLTIPYSIMISFDQKYSINQSTPIQHNSSLQPQTAIQGYHLTAIFTYQYPPTLLSSLSPLPHFNQQPVGPYNIYFMSIRSSLWYDSPLCKPSSLHFHPQIIKHDPENQPDDTLIRATAAPQEIPAYKLNPGPQSPWSAYINPNNEQERGEGIVDRLDYSPEEEQYMATPIRERCESSDMEECELHTTGKKSECAGGGRRRRPKEKGLRQLSQRVYNIIQELQRATYKEVAAKLVGELSRNKQWDTKEEQNIKRRVYDALNVLISLGVLLKEGRKITCSKRKAFAPLLASREGDVESLTKQAAFSQGVIQQKQHKLKLTQQKYSLIEKLLIRNKASPQSSKRIQFPFIGILIKEQALADNHLSSESLLIESAQPLHPFGDIDSIKWLSEHLYLPTKTPQ